MEIIEIKQSHTIVRKITEYLENCLKINVKICMKKMITLFLIDEKFCSSDTDLTFSLLSRGQFYTNHL